VHPDGAYVLYWMIAGRRSRWNFALDRAAVWCRELGKPLLVFEPLRAGYPWACDRFHTFLLQGMVDNRRACADAGVVYWPYVEPEPGAGRGLLPALSRDACAVVTDDHPGFFYPAMLGSAAKQLGDRGVLLEAVDGNGLLPLGTADKIFARAFDFRRHLQKHLLPHLMARPTADPLGGLKPYGLATVAEAIPDRWPGPAPEDLLEPGRLADLPIDHTVGAVALPGGERAAAAALEGFVGERLEAYAEQRNHPDADAGSNLSPYLHFGHLSPHQVFARVAEHQGWTPDLVAPSTKGKREGWWGMGVSAEAFLDQLITWREIGFNRAAREPDCAQYATLPPWALATLEKHSDDPRRYRYSLAQFEQARTHDPLWNAAQRQLVGEGRIHTYLRMLWGKKILEWTPAPQDALHIMLHLNDKYALDGRDPNSVSGITWCLGRADRAWGPERPVFGTVRTMSSENTARKVHGKAYLARYGPG
jgi:deoxyribodipyrimidine photo-lyase